MEPKQGILQSGQLVAVKKLVRTSGVHDRRFQNEAGNLQILEQRNIVKLLGSCYQVEKKLVERNGRHFLSDVPKNSSAMNICLMEALTNTFMVW